MLLTLVMLPTYSQKSVTTNHDDNDDKIDGRIDTRIPCIQLYVQRSHFVAYGILNRNAHEVFEIRIVEMDAVIDVVECHTMCG